MTSKGPRWRREKVVRQYFWNITRNWKVPRKRDTRRKFICGFDPYTLKTSNFEDSVALFPGIEYPDIINYLVLPTSWLTHQQMKAFKSLDAYNLFASGLVKGVLAKELEGDKLLLFSRVS